MKRLGIALIILLVIGGLFAATVWGIGYYLAPQGRLAKSDAVVAISGGETKARTDEAIRLYRDGYASIMIFSGAAADTSGPSNAMAMRQQALAEGIDGSRILLDETSANTSENATAVAKIVHDHSYHSLILVTAPYHQRRANLAFTRALGPGIRVINHSAFDQNWSRSRWWRHGYNYAITLAELQKTLFLVVTGEK